MKVFKRITANDKGVAIVTVILAFLVVSIFAVSILAFAKNTVEQTKNDELRSEGYYFSRAAVEIMHEKLVEALANPMFYADLYNGVDNEFFPAAGGTSGNHELTFSYVDENGGKVDMIIGVKITNVKYPAEELVNGGPKVTGVQSYAISIEGTPINMTVNGVQVDDYKAEYDTYETALGKPTGASVRAKAGLYLEVKYTPDPPSQNLYNGAIIVQPGGSFSLDEGNGKAPAITPGDPNLTVDGTQVTNGLYLPDNNGRVLPGTIEWASNFKGEAELDYWTGTRRQTVTVNQDSPDIVSDIIGNLLIRDTGRNTDNAQSAKSLMSKPLGKNGETTTEIIVKIAQEHPDYAKVRAAYAKWEADAPTLDDEENAAQYYAVMQMAMAIVHDINDNQLFAKNAQGNLIHWKFNNLQDGAGEGLPQLKLYLENHPEIILSAIIDPTIPMYEISADRYVVDGKTCVVNLADWKGDGTYEGWSSQNYSIEEIMKWYGGSTPGANGNSIEGFFELYDTLFLEFEPILVQDYMSSGDNKWEWRYGIGTRDQYVVNGDVAGAGVFDTEDEAKAYWGPPKSDGRPPHGSAYSALYNQRTVTLNEIIEVPQNTEFTLVLFGITGGSGTNNGLEITDKGGFKIKGEGSLPTVAGVDNNAAVNILIRQPYNEKGPYANEGAAPGNVGPDGNNKVDIVTKKWGFAFRINKAMKTYPNCPIYIYAPDGAIEFNGGMTETPFFGSIYTKDFMTRGGGSLIISYIPREPGSDQIPHLSDNGVYGPSGPKHPAKPPAAPNYERYTGAGAVDPAGKFEAVWVVPD